jgi:hypothetical protein
MDTLENEGVLQSEDRGSGYPSGLRLFSFFLLQSKADVFTPSKQIQKHKHI